MKGVGLVEVSPRLIRTRSHEQYRTVPASTCTASSTREPPPTPNIRASRRSEEGSSSNACSSFLLDLPVTRGRDRASIPFCRRSGLRASARRTVLPLGATGRPFLFPSGRQPNQPQSVVGLGFPARRRPQSCHSGTGAVARSRVTGETACGGETWVVSRQKWAAKNRKGPSSCSGLLARLPASSRRATLGDGELVELSQGNVQS